MRNRRPWITIALISILMASGCSGGTTQRSAPPSRGVYLSDGGQYLPLDAVQGWPDVLGNLQKGEFAFFPMTDKTQPHIVIYLETGKDAEVRLKSPDGDVDFKVTYTDPDGKFYEIQPAKKLRGGPNCILLAQSSSDNRHWCFSAGAVVVP